MENDFTWDYGITYFDSKMGVCHLSAVGLSTSDQNSSADDSPRSQIQSTPTNRPGFRHGLGRGLGKDLAKVLRVWEKKLFHLNIYYYELLDVNVGEVVVEAYSTSMNRI